MKRWGTLVFAMALLLAGAGSAYAQGGGASSTGSISGQVVDESGAVLPGVTVTATSPAQIGTLTAITSEEGMYRFPSVPPGEYKLVFELSGFGSLVREGIRVTLGFNAGVNARLSVATLQETVTVTGQSPVVDTTATRIQTNYDQQALASLPNARDMWSLLAASPSITLNRVDVGGSTAGTQTTYFAYGYSGQNRPLIEGINTTEGTAAAGFYLDYGSFEEVFIGAAGNSSEMPNPGVITQFVSKSGGNNFSTSVYYDYENEKIQGRNLDADQIVPNTAIRADGNRLSGYRNLNADVGGPIARDKAWFYFAYLNQENKVASPPAGSFLDGTTFRTKLFNYTGKGTYQLNQNNKFIGYLQHGTKQQPNRTDNSNRVSSVVHITADSTVIQDSPSWVYKGEWNGTLGQNAFAEFRAGQFGYNFGLVSNTNDVRYESIDTGQVIGGGRDWLNKRRRNQYTGSLSLFRDNFIGGAHNLKLGGEYLDESGNITWNQYYRDQVIHFVNGPLDGPLSATTPNGVRLHNPSSSFNGLKVVSLFITDGWTINRFTLNVGARFDRYTPWLPAQSVPVSRFNPTQADLPEVSSVLTFNHIVPRLGGIYDLQGDGKTVLKANYGRFYFNTGVNLADAVNPNTSNQYADHTWNDLNNDRLYQPGEEGIQSTNFRFTGVAGAAIDPDLKNSYTDEASFFVEREVMHDLGVRVGYVWKHDNDGWQQIVPNRPFSAYNVPITVVDPGPDGSAATTADNGTLSLLNLDNPAGRPVTQFVTNIDDYEGTYRTFELSSNKRYSDRWSMNASFSYTWSEEWSRTSFNNVFATAVNQSSLFGVHATNPNERTFHDFTNWNLKFSGTVDAGWGLRVTPVLKSQSGAPYGRIVNVAGCTATVLVNCVNYAPSQAILAEPIGTRRQDTVTLLDFRVEKQIPIDRARIGLFFDLFNAMNSNTAVNLTWTSGARFERAATVIPPRIAKFGVKFNW